MSDAVNIAASVASFAEPWQPRRLASVNDYDVELGPDDGHGQHRRRGRGPDRGAPLDGDALVDARSCRALPRT